MKHVLLITLAALPLFAQQPQPAAAAAPSDGEKIVAVVNGEKITKEALDRLWARAGERTRANYEKNGGGKMGFLDNYIKKRLLIQEALKAGFEKQEKVKFEMEAAKESALFDLYVRDVVSTQVLAEAEIRKFYDDHPDDFMDNEQVKVRHILVTPRGRDREQARAHIGAVMQQLMPFSLQVIRGESAPRTFLARFSEVAKQVSEDVTAANGGDLGWYERERLDPKFAEVAFNLKPGVMSGIVETEYGFHLLVVEDKKPARKRTYEEARPGIREFLLGQKAAAVVETVAKLTNELRRQSKVSVFPENAQ